VKVEEWEPGAPSCLGGGFPSKGMLEADSERDSRWLLGSSGAANRNLRAIVKKCKADEGNDNMQGLTTMCLVMTDHAWDI
jgi:hypothetical protein